MKVTTYTAPTVEPISLEEVKAHLRLDSGSFADNIDELQCIPPAAHAITVGYALIGSAVDVLLYESVVFFNSGTNAATGTVDVKIQHSDDNVTYTDWIGGAFTQVTTANDNAIYEKAYTGGKRYIRCVAQVLLAACSFGVSVIRKNTASTEDTYLTALITQAREYVEASTWRRLITQTLDIYFDDFPTADNIALPFGNLQTVTHFKYTDSAGTETTLVEDTDYIVETNGPAYGRLVLPNDVLWPTDTLKSSNPITVRFTCGYGDAAADVPQTFKAAMLLLVAGWYGQRSGLMSSAVELREHRSIETMLWQRRLF